MSNVFVYGTLMFPEVLQSLIQRQPKALPAIVKGYSRHAIKGQVFPAIIPSASTTATVQGLVLFSLTPDELEIFDEFEGDEYIKTPITPELLPSTSSSPSSEQVVDSSTLEQQWEQQVEECSIYVWQESLRSMLKMEGWDPDAFRTEHLAQYTVMCDGFAQEFREMKQASGRPFTWGDGGEQQQ